MPYREPPRDFKRPISRAPFPTAGPTHPHAPRRLHASCATLGELERAVEKMEADTAPEPEAVPALRGMLWKRSDGKGEDGSRCGAFPRRVRSPKARAQRRLAAAQLRKQAQEVGQALFRGAQRSPWLPSLATGRLCRPTSVAGALRYLQVNEVTMNINWYKTERDYRCTVHPRLATLTASYHGSPARTAGRPLKRVCTRPQRR